MSKKRLSTGSTLLNLACSGTVSGAYPKGSYIFFVGDSESGKTWLAMTCFAEAARSPIFSDYRLIFDNVEDGALMDLAHYFGEAAAAKIEPPRGTREEPTHSETVEDFYYAIDDALADGRPFVYVLDSMDALTPAKEVEKFTATKKASREGKKESGDYGMAKAKLNSQHLRRLVPKLRDSGSILIIISQTRENIDPMSFETRTRAGGKALKFYATLELWTVIKTTLKKTAHGKPRTIGTLTEVKVKKNRVNGRKHAVTVPILYDYGIDDIGACVDWLVDEGVWKNSNGSIDSKGFAATMKRDKLIRVIEDEDRDRDLRQLVKQAWDEIDQALKPKRKKRYE